MEKLKKKRTALRTMFTKTLNALKEESTKSVEEIDTGTLIDRLTKINNYMNDLKQIDNDILDYLVESDATQDEINFEVEDKEKYSDEFISITRKVNEILLSLNNEGKIKENLETDLTNPGNRGKHYKLPKLNIPVFDGTLLNYLSFWSQFKKIHEDEELDDCDKFQYLLQSVQPGTRARDVLGSYPLTSENYPKAVEAFQERYGKKEILVEVYVRELLKLIISNVRANGKEKLPLADLYIKVDAYLRSLESMDVNPDANATWLFPMVESSLPEETLKAWQRSPLFTAEIEEGKSRLSNLLKFLKQEVEGEERLQLARRGFENSVTKEDRVKPKPDKHNNRSNVPTVAGLHTVKEQKCVFCDKSHKSAECFKARTIPLKDKIETLKQKKCCLKCLKPFHFAKDCKQFVRCHICEKPHSVVLCPSLETKNESVSIEKKDEVVQSAVANHLCSHEVALMVLDITIGGNKVKKKVRALLDSGSQRSYILKSTAEELGLIAIGTENICHTLFGGAKTEAKSYNKYHIKLYPPSKNKEHFEFEFLDQNVLCGDIPRLPKGPLLKELKTHRIWITEFGSGCPKIEMLIGSDIYGKLMTGRVKQLQGDLTAIETKFGWTICGKLENPFSLNEMNCSAMLQTNLAMKHMKVPDLWNLETIGITDPGEKISRAEEEEMAQEQFLKELRRNEDGRYCVSLPWIYNKIEIPSNRNIAEKRLFSATRRLKTLGKFEDYDKVFREWHEEGIIEEVPLNDLENDGHYLPHHPVFKPESLTTKVRPVFDASCKVENSPSLNDCLVTGPNLMEQIPSVLLKFRENRIGVLSDIKGAFLQIEINKSDRDYLRFLWWKSNDEIQVFRHKRVVFGLRSSPFLLLAVLKYHLGQAPKELEYLTEKLSKSFYVDNCITSLNDEAELKDFILKSTEYMSKAKMVLRMWEFGPRKEINQNYSAVEFSQGKDFPTPVSVVGVWWNRHDDSLMIANKFEEKTMCPSKREILSITQGIFDPIGILAPILLPAKLLIQEAWASKSSWDSPLPEELQKRFLKWYNELNVLTDLKVPRRIGFGNRDSWSIHTFCDASQNSYATVIFLRCEDREKITVQLIGAKSRISPLKKITIPRLELLACVLGARLSTFILEALDLSLDIVKFYSDSSTALAWIKRNDQWGTFVGNRVKEICKLTNPCQWYFIPGNRNPADLPSRGCNPKQLLNSKWWEGPKWLMMPEDQWPVQNPELNEDEILSERRKTVAVNLMLTSENSSWTEKISNFSRIIRVLAWMRRFYKNARNINRSHDKSLSTIELEEAEDSLWHIVQNESFLKREGNSINGLNVIFDDTGLIRLKTKIIEREDKFSFRYPILLPAKHHVVTCLVREYHLRNCHAGVQILASKLREKYWIIASKRLIRNVVTKCIRCKRFAAKASTSAPIHLPLDRVRDASAFEVTGIDLCGPLFLRNKKKSWIVLFTCAVYRALHLEAVTALSTEAFIQSLRRFIARRGRPSTIYSDNGTNLVGTRNLLKELDWDKIQSTECLTPIKWKFIPPTAAWWGGWWERLVRSVKTLLVRVLNRSSVSYEELCTVLCDIEATINCRPLTYISDGSEDLVPLTPSMFLQDTPEVGVADLDNIDSKRLQIRHSYCQQLREELRSRFRKEYLSQLVQKSSTKSSESSIQVGDVVLVGLENHKRLDWPMARVQKIFPSRDGKVRVAELKTMNGTLVRPVQKLYPLEVSSATDAILQQKRSKRGRLLKPPERLEL